MGGGIAAAKAKPGGMEEQLEQMATFANNLQEQLATTEKERDSQRQGQDRVARERCQGQGGRRQIQGKPHRGWSGGRLKGMHDAVVAAGRCYTSPVCARCARARGSV